MYLNRSINDILLSPILLHYYSFLHTIDALHHVPRFPKLLPHHEMQTYFFRFHIIKNTQCYLLYYLKRIPLLIITLSMSPEHWLFRYSNVFIPFKDNIRPRFYHTYIQFKLKLNKNYAKTISINTDLNLISFAVPIWKYLFNGPKY